MTEKRDKKIIRAKYAKGPIMNYVHQFGQFSDSPPHRPLKSQISKTPPLLRTSIRGKMMCDNLNFLTLHLLI